MLEDSMTEAVPISIVTGETNARFSLRLSPAAAVELCNVGPFRLDMPINQCATLDGRISARLGPDEWLLLGPRTEHVDLARNLDAALATRLFSLVDISHRNVAITVAGLHAREVINGGCPLDLRDAAFPPAYATRTILGRAEIVLLRPDTPLEYRIECWRSFAPYVRGLLSEVAREFHQSDCRTTLQNTQELA